MYKINDGVDIQINSTSAQTIDVPTNVAGVFMYRLVKVTDETETVVLDLSATVTVNALPDVDFLYIDTQCSGTGVKFTSTISGNYNYLWDFGDGAKSTDANPSHTYKAFGSGTASYNVQLTVKDNTTSCEISSTKTITLKQIPEAALDTTGINGATFYDPKPTIRMFKYCNATTSSPQFDFIAVNASKTISSNSSYTIDWGDGNSENLPNTFTTKTHRYITLGFFDIKITSFNATNNCSSSKSYQFFNGNSPGGNLSNIINTSDCVPYSITWPLENTKNNTPGTTYTFSIDDGSPNQSFTQVTLPESISHTFTKSACDKTDQKFTITLKVANPCSTSASTLQVQATQKPTAKFSISPDSIICLNSTATFKNTSNSNYLPVDNCFTNFNKTWSITPINGWSGTISNSESIAIKFTTAGDYTIKLKIRATGSATASRCTEDSITRIIHVNSLPTAIISGGATVCQSSTPLPNITFTGANGTAPYTFKYTLNGITNTVTTTFGNIATVSAPTTATGTFTYSLISVQEGSTAACTQTQTGSAIVVVNPKPTGTITGSKGVCLGDIPPLITFTGSNGTPPYTFTYNIEGGENQTITTTTGNSVTVTVPTTTAGVLKYNLTIVQDASANGCKQTLVSSAIVTVNPIPTVVDIPSQSKCNGDMSDAITFSGSVTGTVYNWTNDNASIGLGAIGQGNINSFKLLNTTAIVQKAIVIVTPTNTIIGVSCPGVSKTFIITVNPAPSITKQPISSAVCKGGTASPLWVEYKNGIGKGTFQWYSNNVNSNIGGIKISNTDSIFSPPTTTVETLYYYCIVTLNMGGCSLLTSNTASVAVTEVPAIKSQPTATQSICVGGTVKTPLLVSYSGGAGVGNCQWFINATNTNTGGTLIAGATNLSYTPPAYVAVANYFYYAEISFTASGCTKIVSDVAEVVVASDPTVTLQPLPTQTLCQGATAASLKVAASAGIGGGYAFQWYSNTVDNNTSGKLIADATLDSYLPLTTTVGTSYYYCVVSQPNGADCFATSATAAVIVNAVPTITNQPISSSVCLNGTPATLSVAYTNGVGTASYQWYKNTVDNTTSGTKIADETTASYLPPTVSIDTTFYYCIISLSTGGCSNMTSNTASVAVTPIPTVVLQPTTLQNVCVGGIIKAPLTVGYSSGAGTVSYQWYANASNTTTGGTIINGATNASFTPSAFSAVGKYYFYSEIKFSGSACGFVLSDTARINVVADPIVTTQPLSTQTLCQNTVPTILSVESSGGIGLPAYQWYQNSSKSYLGTAILTATTITFSPPTSVIGTTYYYCEISQKEGQGCAVLSDFSEVIVKPAPTFTTQPSSSTVCIGQTPTALIVEYKDGTGTPSYQWYSNTTNAHSGSSIATGTNKTFIPPASTIGTVYYYCMITLPSGGCSSIISDIAQVTIKDYPSISDFDIKSGSGEAFSVTPKALNGNVVPVGTTYTWSAPTVAPANSITGTSVQSVGQDSISQTLTNNTKAVGTVTYTVTPRSGNCVGAAFKVVVTVYPPINPNVTISNISCFGLKDGSITTNVQGGIPPYNITLYGPNGFSSDKTTISGLEKGDYMLNVFDNSNSGFVTSLKIEEPYDITLVPEIHKNVTCNGAANGEISVFAGGGTGAFSYAWTKDNVAFATTQNIDHLSPGEYKVTVTDANKCNPKTLSFSITEPAPLVITLSSQTNNICFGDTQGGVSIAIQGGTKIEISPGVFDYKYAWTGPKGFTSIDKDLTNVISGKYNLKVTDNSGCSQLFVITITQPDEILLSATTTPIICYGANNATLKLNITGGVKPYKAVWDNFASGDYQENLSAGDYIITVTDANSCVKTIKVNIPEAPIFKVTPIVKNVSCFGAKDGSISLNFEGGKQPISFAWTDNSTSGTTRNNIGPGTYTVNIIDVTPCSIYRTFTITEPQPLRLSAMVTNALNCDTVNSGAINLQVTGGSTPYVYAWSNGSTTEDLVNVAAGNYNVMVTDSNKCTQTANYIVTRPLPISINIATKADYNCSTKYLKEISTATFSGGLPPYKLTWSSGTVSGVNAEVMETDQSGIIILDVTDKLGCTARYTFDLLVPTPGIDYQLVDCDKHNYIFKSIIPTGEAIDYTYAWNFGDGTTGILQNPQHKFTVPGTYKVTLTLKNKTCSSDFEKYVTVEAPPVLVLDKLPIYCIGDSLLLQVSGANTYLWNNGTVGDSLLIKQTGNYSVTGTSKAGCTSTLNFTATNFNTYNFTIQTDKNEITTENTDLQLWSEGIMFSEYFWNFGDSLSAEGNNQNHSYKIQKGGYYDVRLRVKNPNGCNEYANKRIWITDTSENNTFTPNGDGVDDVFLKGWHTQIYNRNGILLYDGTVSYDGWDGTYKGSPVANDTYFYVEFISTLDGIKTKTGFVTVIR